MFHASCIFSHVISSVCEQVVVGVYCLFVSVQKYRNNAGRALRPNKLKRVIPSDLISEANTPFGWESNTAQC